ATDVRGRPPNAAGDTFRAAQQHPLSGYPAQTAGRPGAAAPSLASGVSDADTEAAYRAEFGNSGASASGTASEVHAHGQKPAAKPSGRSVLVVGLVTPTGNPSGPPSVPPPPDTALNSAGPDNNAAVAPEGLQTVPVAPSLPNTLPTQVQQPILVSRVQPAYPPLAKSVRLQGTVEFIATVGRDGAVKSVQLIRGPQLLVDAARDAVMRWRYRPSTVNGVPMEARTKVSVIFQLD
ncbi:MAG: energy transducer TonB, partial [Acidobacteriaceae bacterium]|nr:energy transducer TonB [Acidobacteriaceae bacterium]